MGFVGGGDNIAIATALPPSSFVYCIVNTRQFLDFLYLFFFTLAWGFGFRTWRRSLAHGVLFLLPAKYSGVMCGFWLGTLVTDRGVVSVSHTVVLWDFGLRYVSRVTLWFAVLFALTSCAGAGCLWPEVYRHTHEMDTYHYANSNLRVIFLKWCFWGFVVWDRTSKCSVFTRRIPGSSYAYTRLILCIYQAHLMRRPGSSCAYTRLILCVLKAHLMRIPGSSYAYTMLILCVHHAHLMRTPGSSYAYTRLISCVYQAHLMQAYLMSIPGSSYAYTRLILCIYQVHLMHIPGWSYAFTRLILFAYQAHLMLIPGSYDAYAMAHLMRMPRLISYAVWTWFLDFLCAYRPPIIGILTDNRITEIIHYILTAYSMTTIK